MELREHLESTRFVVVGAGFFGLTCAERIADKFNEKVLVIEKRSHIGGNAWSEFDSSTGIEVHKYGSHLFHTSNRKVIDYVSRFSEFNGYRHKVISKVGDTFYPIPINLMTLSSFFGVDFSPASAKIFLDSKSLQAESLSSFEFRHIQ